MTQKTKILPTHNNRRVVISRKKQPHIPDLVFFTINQIKIGSTLRYIGRMDPGSLWKVTSIKTFRQMSSKGSNKVKYSPGEVTTPLTLADDIRLTRIGDTGEYRICQFAYLSYSAIWQLVVDQEK